MQLDDKQTKCTISSASSTLDAENTVLSIFVIARAFDIQSNFDACDQMLHICDILYDTKQTK